MIKEARRLLKEIYGYDDFRRGQKIIVDSVLKGRDTLGVMVEENLSVIKYQLFFLRE